MAKSPARPALRNHWSRPAQPWLILGLIVLVALLSSPGRAIGGQAASGELLFYPCTSCHPVMLRPGTETPTKKLPNGFDGHQIMLEGHDALGRGSAACLVCHDDPSRDPGKLKLADGALVDIKGDVALVCYRCHSDKYKQWKAGTHGRNQPKCTASGCHDPHTPSFIYAPALMPFVGNGFQFKGVAAREPFSPLARPAPAPSVETPAWFMTVAYAGLFVVGGMTGGLVMGRRRR